MAKKRFKAEQIVMMLREANLPHEEAGIQLAKGLNIEEVSRNLRVAPQSYYKVA